MTNLGLLSQQAAQRAQGYWLVSRLFLEVPTEAMLTEIRQSLGAASNEPHGPEVATLLEALDAALLEPEAAAIAFTRHLCLGDKAAQEPLPFEAHVREGRLPGACTAQVEAMVRAAGFGEVAPGAASPDHLGAELRFMALLCHDERQAWLAGDDGAAGKALAAQRAFVGEHLAAWVPGYCRDLAGRTTNGYLRGVAQLGERIVLDDAALIEEICQWILPAGLPGGTASEEPHPLQ